MNFWFGTKIVGLNRYYPPIKVQFIHIYMRSKLTKNTRRRNLLNTDGKDSKKRKTIINILSKVLKDVFLMKVSFVDAK